jgi:hypothetical protein
MILHINNNDALINNNYGRLRDLILLFRIPMGTKPASAGHLEPIFALQLNVPYFTEQSLTPAFKQASHLMKVHSGHCRAHVEYR